MAYTRQQKRRQRKLHALDANHSEGGSIRALQPQNGGRTARPNTCSYTPGIGGRPSTRAAAWQPRQRVEIRGDYDGAEKMFPKAIELDPKYTRASLELE